ncbi:MAG: hypothetical protein Q9169_002991 [Polycauliona sp. 2 TL-2023]
MFSQLLIAALTVFPFSHAQCPEKEPADPIPGCFGQPECTYQVAADLGTVPTAPSCPTTNLKARDVPSANDKLSIDDFLAGMTGLDESKWKAKAPSGKDKGSSGKDKGSPGKDKGSPGKDKGSPGKDKGSSGKDAGATGGAAGAAAGGAAAAGAAAGGAGAAGGAAGGAGAGAAGGAGSGTTGSGSNGGNNNNNSNKNNDNNKNKNDNDNKDNNNNRPKRPQDDDEEDDGSKDKAPAETPVACTVGGKLRRSANSFSLLPRAEIIVVSSNPIKSALDKLRIMRPPSLDITKPNDDIAYQVLRSADTPPLVQRLPVSERGAFVTGLKGTWPALTVTEEKGPRPKIQVDGETFSKGKPLDWEIRWDFDPKKGPHVNARYGSIKYAFCLMTREDVRAHPNRANNHFEKIKQTMNARTDDYDGVRNKANPDDILWGMGGVQAKYSLLTYLWDLSGAGCRVPY